MSGSQGMEPIGMDETQLDIGTRANLPKNGPVSFAGTRSELGS